MAYSKQTWNSNDLIAADKLNHMEDGIEAVDIGKLDKNFDFSEASVPYAGTEKIALRGTDNNNYYTTLGDLATQIKIKGIHYGENAPTDPDTDIWIDPSGISWEDEKMDEIVSEASQAVEAWLNDHVNPQSDVIIDNSLSISGAAADAAAVGDEFDELTGDVDDLKSAFVKTTGTEKIEFTEGYYVATSGSVGATVDQTMISNASWWCAIVDCSENDGFLLNLKGGNTPKAWCFVDAESKILSAALNSVTATDLLLIAPKNASKLILNDNNRGAKSSYKRPVIAVYDQIAKIDSRISDVKKTTDYLFNGFILPVSSTGATYQEYAIVSGHVYTVTNQTNQACGLYTGNTKNADTVQTVSTRFAAGTTIQFTASANANYIRVSFPSTAPTGSILLYDNASLVESLFGYFPDKTLVTLGDSIFGNNAESGSGVGDYISGLTGMQVINAAFGGTRMVRRSSDITVGRCAFDFENLVDAIIDGDFSAQQQAIEDHGSDPSIILPYYSNRLATLSGIDWSSVDYVTINYGTNDWEAATAASTYISVYKAALTKFLTAFPHIKIILITTTFRFWQDANHNITDDSNTKTYGNPAVNLPKFNENIYAVGESMQLPVIDAYNIGINRDTAWTYFTIYDTTHHTTAGRKHLGEHIGRQILASNTGKIADVAKIEEELKENTNKINSIETIVTDGVKNELGLWASGDIYAISGRDYANSKRIRTIGYISDDIRAAEIMDASYGATVFAYDTTDDSCKGILQPGYTFSTQDRTLFSIDFAKLRATYPTYKYRITLRRADNGDITTGEYLTLAFVNYITPYNAIVRRPLLTFIDDDGAAEGLAIWEGLVDQLNIPVTMALTTGTVGTGNKAPWSTIERLNNKGFEFISHTDMHINMSNDDMTESAIKADFEATISALNQHHCNPNFVVYPYTTCTARNQGFVKEYFCLGIDESLKLNVPYMSRTGISRYNLNKSPMVLVDKVIDGQTVQVYPYKTFAEMKAIIDGTIANNGWAIFMSHLRNTYASDGFYYDDEVGKMIIQSCNYARENGVSIVTVEDAYKMYRPFIT